MKIPFRDPRVRDFRLATFLTIWNACGPRLEWTELAAGLGNNKYRVKLEIEWRMEEVWRNISFTIEPDRARHWDGWSPSIDTLLISHSSTCPLDWLWLGFDNEYWWCSKGVHIFLSAESAISECKPTLDLNFVSQKQWIKNWTSYILIQPAWFILLLLLQFQLLSTMKSIAKLCLYSVKS